jgi:hypothetical protein
MKTSFTPFFIFLVLLLFTVPLPSDLAFSVVPGWHETIFPTHFILQLVVFVLLLCTTFGYWQLSKGHRQMNWTKFILHIILTIPIVVCIKFPSLLVDWRLIDQGGLSSLERNDSAVLFFMLVLFLLGQILFLVYYIKAMRTRKTTT